MNDLIIIASRGNAPNISCANASEIFKNKSYETTVAVWWANSSNVTIYNNNSDTGLWLNGWAVRPN